MSVWLGAGGPVCVCVHVACIQAPNLTRYHMKMVLKAFSLEQEPQAIVMSWDMPLGATCGRETAVGSPPPQLERGLCRGCTLGPGGCGRLGGKQGCSPGGSLTGAGWSRGPKRPQVGAQRGKKAKKSPDIPPDATSAQRHPHFTGGNSGF